MKLFYTLVFFLLTSVIYGQKSTLYQNVNVRAKELKHKLNESGDSLIFKCERTVYEVVIFNDDFERVIKVRDTEAKIPIADVPVGRYIIEALLSDKLIVMTLLRNESFDTRPKSPLITDNSNLFGKKIEPKEEVIASVEKTIEVPTKAVEPKLAEVTKEIPKPKEELFGGESTTKKTDLAVAGKKAEPKPVKKQVVVKKKKPKKSSLSLFNSKTKVAKKKTPKRRPTREIDAARANRIVSTYWVEYIINNGQSTQKIQKLGDQETVERMIKKIEIDKKTKAGQLNELTVWTVFDPPKFVKHKKMNKHNFTEVASESFKMEPYYKKVNNPDNL